MKDVKNIITPNKISVLINWSAIFLATIAITISVVNFYGLNSNTRWGVVDLNEVYTSFDLTKKLDNELNQFGMSHKFVSDSIEFELKRLEYALRRQQEPSEKDIDAYYLLKNSYQGLISKYEAEKDEMVHKYNTQIFNQLNQYVSEFSEKRNIEILFGSKGDGTIMYASQDGKDYTEEIISFINMRYNGS